MEAHVRPPISSRTTSAVVLTSGRVAAANPDYKEVSPDEL
jgi:hypothetical protein